MYITQGVVFTVDTSCSLLGTWRALSAMHLTLTNDERKGKALSPTP
ncbi:hypothetical protein [Coleofasciculus sp.]